MSKPVELRPRAEQDLLVAADAIAGDSPDTAQRFVDVALQAICDLGQMPGLGPAYPISEHGLPGLRKLKVPGFPYLIFYLVDPDRVVILRILHGARDLPEVLRSELDS